MKKEFIVNRQGKDFVLYAGLLDQAHQEGLKRIGTTLLQAPSDQNGQLAIVYAEVETAKGVFSGIGDAAPGNVGRMVAMHLTRLAETRAKARALRDAINVGVSALEELADADEGGEVGGSRAVDQPVARRLAAVAGDGSRGWAGGGDRVEGTGPATAQQLDRMMKLQAALGRPKQAPEGISFEAAARQITELVREFNAQARSARRRGS